MAPGALCTGDDTVTPPTNTGSTPSPWARRRSSAREDLTGGQVTLPMVTELVERVLTVSDEWWEVWEVREVWDGPEARLSAVLVRVEWEWWVEWERWEWVEATLLAALWGYPAATGVVAPATVVVAVAVAVVGAGAGFAAVAAAVEAGWVGPPSLSMVEPKATLAWLTPTPPAPWPWRCCPLPWSWSSLGLWLWWWWLLKPLSAPML